MEFDIVEYISIVLTFLAGGVTVYWALYKEKPKKSKTSLSTVDIRLIIEILKQRRDKTFDTNDVALYLVLNNLIETLESVLNEFER